MKSIFLAALAVSSVAIAQDQAPTGLAVAEEWVKQLDTAWASGAAVLILELILRLKKTETPKSVLYVIANTFKLVGKVCEFCGNALDKVVQRLKEPTTP